MPKCLGVCVICSIEDSRSLYRTRWGVNSVVGFVTCRRRSSGFWMGLIETEGFDYRRMHPGICLNSRLD